MHEKNLFVVILQDSCAFTVNFFLLRSELTFSFHSSVLYCLQSVFYTAFKLNHYTAHRVYFYDAFVSIFNTDSSGKFYIDFKIHYPPLTHTHFFLLFSSLIFTLRLEFIFILLSESIFILVCESFFYNS